MSWKDAIGRIEGGKGDGVKAAFWTTDGFTALLVTILFLAAGSAGVMQGLERKAYDLGVLASSRAPGGKVAVIAIDERSLANIGRWPWPRNIHAKMVDILAQAHAKAIGYAVLFSEPQRDPGLVYIDRLIDFYRTSSLSTAADPLLHADIQHLGGLLTTAAHALNTDQQLAHSVRRAGNVVLGMLFHPGVLQGRPDRPPPDYLLRNALAGGVGGAGESGWRPPAADEVFLPIPALGRAAAGLGHLNVMPDVDGAVRVDLLAMRYDGRDFPSFSLALAAAGLNLKPADIHIAPGRGIRLGHTLLATDPDLALHTFFYPKQNGRPPFTVDSFFDVYSGKIPASKYRGKIVLIGPTAAGVGAAQVTPVSPAMPPVLTLAHQVSSILNRDYFIVPPWAFWAEKGVFLAVALYLIFWLPRLRAGAAAALTVLGLAALLAAQFLLMTVQAMWLQLMLPAVFLLAGHGVLTTKRYLLTERGKAQSEAESAESNRLLGLAFQGQGQLDMAFDKFRKCPVDDSMQDLLYNLALDFERKRQFNKATAVFQYLADVNPGYRDLSQRLARAKAMEESVLLGAGSHGAASLLTDGALEKPMLGRYRVEKELGKGAMGAVYLGKDPKIGRQVAIKTMALSQEFEGDELEEVKTRFFREAETAGRLNHPNIVTIYDAGEEQDLAYIAMERLSGKDLSPYIKPGALLPLGKVLKIMAKVAAALHYAHSQQVVHRDIKPANIMYEPDTDTIKVTDFGIARITDSSKTKTGMVLGTPSYMSPEQLAGKKVDGRSDLFSLGVMFYQLLTGALPFQGESLTELMYRIANQPHADIQQSHPRLPECVASIVNKMLQKPPEQRYQSGNDVARAIVQCASQIAAAMGRKKA
ncbi:MAG TPA: serine/threonine protein kinase [Betaproteobacteria bacterium]|nr:serine/threonine protein kinase [Betaproteobacteria bacterium]